MGKDQCWNINMTSNRGNKRSHIGGSEDKKLELRLGLPGDIDHHDHDQHEDKKALVVQTDDSLIMKPSASKEETRNWLVNRPFVASPGLPSLAFQNEEPKASFKKKCPHHHGDDENCGEKRTARAPVVGWPPVRSFRKNIGSNSLSKTPIGTFGSDEKKSPKDEGKTENGNNKYDDKDHMFVKINMEGVPIGRKVDLKAYDSYEKLSYAIDELFRGLLAAQIDYSAISEKTEETRDAKTVANGEYTLVYEDNEGDRMLVGDVPWKMFVSTAKRLRVLRTVELSTLKVCNGTQMENTPSLVDSTVGIIGR